jgi:putative membrane protein insertion efficiency factor
MGNGASAVVIRSVTQFFARATHALTGSGPCCRFHPTCSQYTETAFQRFGLFQAAILSAGRLLRCHPWGGSGFDPLPSK